MTELIIDLEFSSLLPAQTPEALKRLEEGLLETGGSPDPIVVWAGHNTILEGHSRYRLCIKHGLAYKTRQLALPNREACILWIKKWQASRRNLTDEQQAVLIGEIFNLKQAQNAFGHGVQNKGDLAEEIGGDFGVSGKTVQRDAEFAKAIAEIKSACESVADKILGGNSGYTRDTVLDLAAKLRGRCDRCRRFIALGGDPVRDCPRCKEVPKGKKGKGGGGGRRGKPKPDKPIVFIPTHLQPIFDSVPDFRGAASLATKLGNAMQKLEASLAYKAIYPPGKRQTVHSFAAMELATKLRRMCPKQPCFVCAVREPGVDDAGCDACKGKGYQTEQDAALAKKRATTNGAT